MNVLVTGGTGTVGRHIVMRLRQQGHRARIFSRDPRGHVDAVQGDLNTGAGLTRAVAGMDTIVHAATGARQSLRSRGDVGATERLLDVAHESRIKHIVYVSIVGIDQVPYPYYRTKLMVELLLRKNRVPWSILRTTQFHNLMEVLLRGFSRVPGVTAIPFAWQFQPVDADEVAARVVEVVLGEPAGVLPDFGGPEIRDFKTIARSWLHARKDHRALINLPLPLPFSRHFAEGRLLAPEHMQGKITFDEYLAETYPLS
jgi:uncharacterized protein YbjT (DUF2867 family)